MAQWLPESWRQGLQRLREDIHRALDRWTRRRRAEDNAKEADGQLPVRWNAPVEQLRADIHRILDLWSTPWRALEERGQPSVVNGGLLINIEETHKEVIVVTELPGVDKDDFTVEITGNRLVLRGEKRHETEAGRRGYHYAERTYGAFARVIPLPSEVKAGKTTAKYRDGLLRITLPKTARGKAKRYDVQVGE